MNVVLISTYELGRQPFGLASPAAWLREAGAQVTCLDLAVQPLDERAVASAGLIGVYLPMHTATRLAAELIPRLRALAPRAHLCCFGLYAPGNEALLRSLGADTLIGGEFEGHLAALYRRLAGEAQGGSQQAAPLLSVSSVTSVDRSSVASVTSVDRLDFRVPDRAGLPPLEAYARVRMPDGSERLAGYTEASRGCKHLCRHCPVVPVYGGRFRVAPEPPQCHVLPVRGGDLHVGVR